MQDERKVIILQLTPDPSKIYSEFRRKLPITSMNELVY